MLKNEEEIFLTICIPTYNRKNLLGKLLNSIHSVGGMLLEVIIIDDGSTDGTEGYIKQFSRNAPYLIRYIWQENTGRAIALRESILLASGRYTLVMDSDDFFLEGAFEQIFSEIQVLDLAITNMAGVVFNTQMNDGTLIGTKFPEDRLFSNLTKIRADYGVKGDKKEIIRTSIIKEEIYESICSERRVPTSLLWAKIAEKYDCIFINKSIIVKDYLENGMTKNASRLRLSNPYSMALYYEILTFSKRYNSLLFRIKSSLMYLRYSLLSAHSKIKFSFWLIPIFIPALLIFCVDKLLLRNRS